ncbi:MAG TPA: hypothetical protein VM659_28760 [Dongiaceae bacterium]|nr:hypothetical protein [Dongiaceae bacterium]
MSLIDLTRRQLLRMGAGLIVAPAIVRASSLMPVKPAASVIFRETRALQAWQVAFLAELGHITANEARQILGIPPVGLLDSVNLIEAHQ